MAAIQAEMSLVSLYDGGLLHTDIVVWTTAHGFCLMGLEPGFAHPSTRRPLQLDGIFFRE
jgi:hypothetical protein